MLFVANYMSSGDAAEPSAAASAAPRDAEAATSGEGDEEEETCGFCIFMKAGGCKDAFNVRTCCCSSKIMQFPTIACQRGYRSARNVIFGWGHDPWGCLSLKNAL